VEKTSKFGAVKPQLPTLIHRLKKLVLHPWPKKTIACQFLSHCVGHEEGSVLMDCSTDGLTWPHTDPCGDDLVYIDPDYQPAPGKTMTGYGWSFPRGEVVKTSLSWKERKARVLISEAEPVWELSDWWACNITKGLQEQNRSTFSRNRSEWLTASWNPGTEGWYPVKETER